MPDEAPCTLIGRVQGSETPWEFIFAKPNVIGSGSLSPGAMARATYYYIRSFENEFRCACGGREATTRTSRNVEVGTIEEENQQFFPVLIWSVSIPGVGGFAGEVAIEVAQRVLGGIDNVLGWLDPKAVKARAEELLGTPTITETRAEAAPVAICGTYIRTTSEVLRPWPPEGETLPPPTPEEEEAARIAREIRGMKGSIMEWFERWLRTIREMLGDRDPQVREEGRRQLEALKRELDRLLEIWREILRDLEAAKDTAGHSGH